jgi:ferric-dicitrate binding protein FerR (iron transport regulator)
MLGHHTNKKVATFTGKKAAEDPFLMSAAGTRVRIEGSRFTLDRRCGAI